MTSRHKLSSDLLQPIDLPYEYQLQTDPTNESLWLEYASSKDVTNNTFPLNKCYILRRALHMIPHSEKLWLEYLEERVELLRGLLPIGEYLIDFEKVKDEFEMGLSFLRESLPIWESYLKFIEKLGDLKQRRIILNRMLKVLSLENHDFIWIKFLEFADFVKGKIASSIYSRYLIYKPLEIEFVLQKFLEFKDLEKALSIFKIILNDETFISQMDKTPWDYFVECMELLTEQKNAKNLNRLEIFIKQGIIKFPTQSAELYVTLATHFQDSDFHKCQRIHEEALKQVKTLQHFTIIFESYTNSLESQIKKLITSSTESIQLDIAIQILETLLDNQPFLISDIKLNQSPNDVQLWLDRINLISKSNIELILQTYVQAITTIKPEQATSGLSQIWLNYSRIYEDHKDLQTAREILDRAVKVPYKTVEELVEVWIGWAQMEIRRDDLDTAIRVMEVATRIPQDQNVKIDDGKVSVQRRLFKSVKLWSFYLDLKESLVDEDSISQVCELYEKLFQLRIITPLILLNYASFLEDHSQFEKSFQIFERGIKIFKYPVVFEIWNIYIMKFLSRDPSLERVRDLFDRVIDESPTEFMKKFVLMYSEYESINGSITKSISILQKSLNKVPNEDKLLIYLNLLSKFQQTTQLSQIRETYHEIITMIPLSKCLDQLKSFIQLEIQTKEFHRVRELYQYGINNLITSSSRADVSDLFQSWSEFEIQFGDKNSFKQMLKFKRKFEEENYKIINYQKMDIGFIKSSEGPKVNTSEEKVINPDAIDIDLDDI